MGIESAHTELHTHAPSNVTLSTGEDTQVHTLWVSGNGSSVTLLMNPSVILQFTCGSGWETPLSSTLVGIPPPPIRKDSFLPYLLLPLCSCFIMSRVSSIVSHCPPLFFLFFFCFLVPSHAQQYCELQQSGFLWRPDSCHIMSVLISCSVSMVPINLSLRQMKAFFQTCSRASIQKRAPFIYKDIHRVQTS